jgi:hypothetical protein
MGLIALVGVHEQWDADGVTRVLRPPMTALSRPPRRGTSPCRGDDQRSRYCRHAARNR